MNKMFWVCCLLIFGTAMNAQESWSLQKCIDYAVNNSLNLKNAAYAKESASIDLIQSKNAQYPSLNAGSNTFLNFGRTIDPTSNDFIVANFFSNNYSLNSGVMVFNGFRLRNQIKQADDKLKSAILDLDQRERNLKLDVATAYVNALFAKERVSIAEGNLALSTQQLTQNQKLIDAGNAAPNDIYNFQSQVAQNNQQLVAAKNDYSLSLLQLKQLMYVDIDTQMDVVAPENVGDLTDPFSVELSTLMDRGSANRPALQAREYDVRSAEKGVEIAKSQYYPSLTFGGSLSSNYSNQGKEVTGYNTARSNQTVYIDQNPVTIGFDNQIPILANKSYTNQLADNLSYGFGININIPIINNYQAKGSVARAKLGLEQARLSYDLEKQTLQAEIQRAYADAVNAHSNLDASNQALATEQTAYEAATKRYDIGAINAFDLTNAQTRVEIAKATQLNAKYEFIFRSKLLDFYLGKELKLND